MDNTADRQWDKVIWPEEFFVKYFQMTISEFQAEMDDYAGYLSYRVERDLYEVILDKGMGLSLEDLHLKLQWNEPLRTVCAIVLSQGIFQLSERDFFDDDNPGHALKFVDDVDGDALNLICLFPNEIGRALLRILILRGQVFRHIHRVEGGKEQTWPQFLAELNTNRDLWPGLFQPLFSALRHLDFKEIWQAQDLDKLLLSEE